MQEEKETKVTAIFKKLEVNGKTYYKCLRVVPEFTPDDNYDSLADRVNSKKNEFYIVSTEARLNKIGVKPNAIFYEEEGLQLVSDQTELSYIKMKFEGQAKAAEQNSILLNSHELLVKKYVDKIYGDAKCQKNAIKEIVQTIVLNRDINESHLTDRDKYLTHDNIVLFGPVGSGKTILLDALKKNLQIPAVTVELDSDVDTNRELIAQAIINSDREFNGHAVVIVDLDYNRFNQEVEGDPFYPLKDICNSSNLYYSPYLKEPINFKKITFITSVNVAGNMLDVGDLNSYFMHMSGCTKAVGVKRLDMIQTRKVIYDSVFSKIKFCEEIAKKYNRELSIDKKAIASAIKYNEIFNGNVLSLETAILESFKLQLSMGVKKIQLGEEILVILKGLLDTEKESGWLEGAPENDLEEEEEEPTNDIPVDNALANKEKTIADITEKIKKVIKGQDKQVKDLVTVIIDNQEIAHDPLEEYPESNKVNVLIRGASGTGKTEIIRLASKCLGIPMIVEDATRYTEEGYVGESVTDMLLNMYRETGENIEKAERGIIVIDEIDKKANNGAVKSDVSRGAVLDSLLKMVEGEKYQLEYKKATPQGNIIQNIKFDTRRLTFIILGAFDGLDKIRENRVKTASKPKSMGFQTTSQQAAVQKELDGINKNFINKDYTEFGFTEQFINRFDEKIYLNKIDRNTMIEIMKFGDKSPLLLLQKKYAKYGVEIEYTEDFYEKLADIAMTKDSGARSIKEVFGDLKQFIGFSNIQKSKYAKIIFNAACFDDPNALGLVPHEDVKVKCKQ